MNRLKPRYQPAVWRVSSDSSLCGFSGSSAVVLREAGSAVVHRDIKENPQWRLPGSAVSKCIRGRYITVCFVLFLTSVFCFVLFFCFCFVFVFLFFTYLSIYSCIHFWSYCTIISILVGIIWVDIPKWHFTIYSSSTASLSKQVQVN